MSEVHQQLEYEYRKLRYETYAKQHEGLRTHSGEIGKRYGSAMLALAGGSLAISITFLEKIAPHPVPWTLTLLGLSWLHLTLALLLELHALAAAQTVDNELIVSLNGEYRRYLSLLQRAEPAFEQPTAAERTAQAEAAKYKRRLQRLNRWSRFALTTGILLLCAFTFLNLPYSLASRNF